MSRHNTHLSSYLRSNKEKPKYRSSGESFPSQSKTKNSEKGNPKAGNQNFTSLKAFLPDELVSKIFSFLSPSEILTCARVCRSWNAISNEMALWIRHYNLIPRSVRDSITPPERTAPTFKWKKEIIKRMVLQRNKKVKAMLKKLNPYSGLSSGTEQALKFLSIKWQLCFTDKDNQEHAFVNDDMFCFASSLTARWYSFQLPPLPKLKSLTVFALTAVFYHRDWKVHTDSARRSSLLISFGLNDLKLEKEKHISEDEMITLHTLHPGAMIAIWKSSWKDGGELAFFSVCFHFHQLIEKIISGRRQSSYRPSGHKPILDDIQPAYGLQRYSATVELRNQRKLYWGSRYRELFRKSFTNGYLVLQSQREQEGMFNVKTCLPWKTPVFRNIVNDMAVMDLTLFDENEEPMWCISSPVKCVEINEKEVDFTYSDGTHSIIEYEDNIGKAKLDLIWIEKDQQNLVRCLEIHLKKEVINAWFGTNY